MASGLIGVSIGKYIVAWEEWRQGEAVVEKKRGRWCARIGPYTLEMWLKRFRNPPSALNYPNRDGVRLQFRICDNVTGMMSQVSEDLPFLSGMGTFERYRQATSRLTGIQTAWYKL